MRDFQNIEPTEAARRGLRSFKTERRGGAKNVKGMNADAEKYAKALGVNILGRWDESTSAPNPKSGGSITIWRRLYWYQQ